MLYFFQLPLSQQKTSLWVASDTAVLVDLNPYGFFSSSLIFNK